MPMITEHFLKIILNLYSFCIARKYNAMINKNKQFSIKVSFITMQFSAGKGRK